jgi:sRNA-binding regulator protein Hfq
MKETVEPEALVRESLGRAAEPEGFANRKLIRPVLHRPEHAANHSSNHAPNQVSNHAPGHGNGVSHAPNHTLSHNSGPSHSPSHNHGPHHVSNQNHGTHGEHRGGGGKKTPPAETTHAENFYYQKQMQGKVQMVVVLRDGEEVHGVIEWYDRSCLKLNRLDGPNLMIYKPSIKYMYKEGEAR